MLQLKTVIVVLALFLTGCTDTDRNYGNHTRPLASTDAEATEDARLLAELYALERGADIPAVASGRRYGLAELIDIAQLRNPATRHAWLQMRVAGRQAGIVEGALLPFIAATVVAGTQSAANTITLPLSGPLAADNSAHGAAAVITANWLLFDFGENAARQRVANDLTRISGFSFNRLHQQLVFDVAFAYHTRVAALQKRTYAKQATGRAAQLLDAAQRRLEAGIGTEVEVAQARQLLAQTRLTERIASGEANSAAVSLASSLSLPPTTQISLHSGRTSLPRVGDQGMETMINNAFMRRPDVLASLAQVRAAQSNMDAVAASYLPKVILGANVAVGDVGFDLNGYGLDNIGSTRESGAFIGVSVPIFDGNLRRHRTENLHDRLAAARAGVSVARAAASREIAVAYEGLRTALAVNHAAGELVRAAQTTADAADKAYAAGIGTISDASLATLGLFTAKEALVDSRRAAHTAAATLALATGE